MFFRVLCFSFAMLLHQELSQESLIMTRNSHNAFDAALG